MVHSRHFTFVSDRSGSGDEIHVVVVDEDGGISGVVGQVLETFSNLSKAADAKTAQGDNNYYPDVIYNRINTSIGWTQYFRFKLG